MKCSLGDGVDTVGRGLCMKHYRRLLRTGTTDDPVRPVKKVKPEPPTCLQRLFDKFEVTDTCWLWKKPNKVLGYGYVHLKDRTTTPAHRLLYTLLAGPIPDGLQIDHLCRVRACVNPDHLEPVTAHENIMRSPIHPSAINRRKTHCPRGHVLVKFAPGRRRCVECRTWATMPEEAKERNRQAVARYHARRKAARPV